MASVRCLTRVRLGNLICWKARGKVSCDQTQRGAQTSSNGMQGETEQPSLNRNRDIKCFKCSSRRHIASQCPNQRTMLFENGDVETEGEDIDTDSIPPLEEVDDREVAMHGEVLVTRRALSTQVREEFVE